MNVLSVCNGISCGRVALDRTDLKVDNYFSSEIEPGPIKIADKNYPQDIKNKLGDMTKWKQWNLPQIYLLLGGTPCQNLSCAGDGTGLSGKKSKLFYDFVDILNCYKPKYFLFENVESMKKIDEMEITKLLKVQPIMINSNLVSAQNRKRLYWTNIPNITLPEDKGIRLEDILIKKEMVLPKLWHSQKAIDYMNREIKPGKKRLYNGQGVTFAKSEKASTINANFYKGVPYNVLAYSEMEMRKFSLEECEVLQTLSVGYTEGVCDTQRYKALGNGWTIDVIAHILKGIEF